MTLMATVCSVCGEDLKLQHETFDAIDRVFVGRLRCPHCKRTYLDQRKPTEQRHGGSMAKRSTNGKADKPARGRPRQQDLPGTEDRVIKALEDAASDYADIRDRRIALNAEEAPLKAKLLTLMKQHKKTLYRRDGIEIEVVPKSTEETVKVRLRKAGDEDDGDGAEATT